MKILIIRFSSFGDVTQCLSVAAKLKKRFPESEIHWVVRQDLAELLSRNPNIAKVWSLNRQDGLSGLFKLIKELKKQNFSYIYDAHNNLRSFIIGLLLRPPFHFAKVNFIRKSQKRWKRILLFKFHKNLYRQPFSGQRDLLEPLAPWGVDEELPQPPQFFVDPHALLQAKSKLQSWHEEKFIVLAASAAYPLKRWPISHWQRLIQLEPQKKFVLLGGENDLFLNEVANIAPQRVLNLVGKTSLQESAAVISLSHQVIANDTGLLHIAEQLGKNCIALMGPAPFGFPSRKSTKILEINLPCRPCSKHGQGPCRNKELQKCLVDIRPEQVQQEILFC